MTSETLKRYVKKHTKGRAKVAKDINITETIIAPKYREKSTSENEQEEQGDL